MNRRRVAAGALVAILLGPSCVGPAQPLTDLPKTHPASPDAAAAPIQGRLHGLSVETLEASPGESR